MKRFMIVLLSFLILITGCGNAKKEKKNEDLSDGTVFAIGGSKTDRHEAMVFLDAARKEYEISYGPDIWDYRIDPDGRTVEDTVKAEVLESMIRLKIVCMKADEMNIYLSDEELKEADEKAKEYMKSLEGSRLIALGVNENVVRKVYTDNALAGKVFDKLIPEGDEELRKRTFDTVCGEWREKTAVEVNEKVWEELRIPPEGKN